jgi:hypothetical protein
MKRALLLVIGLLCLSSCSPVYKTDYRFVTPSSEKGKLCANSCLDKLTLCKSSCYTRKLECQKIKDLEAENEYLKYVHRQQKNKKPIEKEINDFKSYSSCNTSCKSECDSIHRVCHSNCGGDIVEHTYCTAFCD